MGDFLGPDVQFPRKPFVCHVSGSGKFQHCHFGKFPAHDDLTVLRCKIFQRQFGIGLQYRFFRFRRDPEPFGIGYELTGVPDQGVLFRFGDLIFRAGFEIEIRDILAL